MWERLIIFTTFLFIIFSPSFMKLHRNIPSDVKSVKNGHCYLGNKKGRSLKIFLIHNILDFHSTSCKTCHLPG